MIVFIMQPGLPRAPEIMVMIIPIIIKYTSIIIYITSSHCFASYKLFINLFSTNLPTLSLIKIKDYSRSTVIDAY